MREVFKDIIGYEGFYQISSLGNVKSLERKVKNGNGLRLVREKIRKLNVSEKLGYLQITLRTNENKERCYVHRLVANAFIPNPENKKEVNHINGIKKDARVENLEWVNSSENMKHSYRTGLHACYYKNKSNSPGRKKILAIKDVAIQEFESIKKMCEDLGFNKGTFYNKRIYNKTFTFNGFLICG